MQPSKIRWRLADFYAAALDAAMPEATRLATTIQTWWPAILVALTHDVTNARTEVFNRIIKQTKRVGCSYRNMINHQRRILSHIAVSRPQKISSMNGANPAQVCRALKEGEDAKRRLRRPMHCGADQMSTTPCHCRALRSVHSQTSG